VVRRLPGRGRGPADQLRRRQHPADGAFDDAAGATASWTYQQPGTYTPELRVTDNLGASDTHAVTITAGNSAPTATIASPSSSLRWKVGDTLSLRPRSPAR
jgi:PKD repeat protein